MRTYQARLRLEDDTSLRAFARLFGHAMRSLFAKRRAGSALSKPRFMRDFGLTSRQFNAVKFTLDGMESSIKELRPLQIADLREHPKAVDKKVRKSKHASPAKLHQLQRRRARVQSRLTRLEAETEPRICFGSRKLFNAQHHLEENGFASLAGWHEAWQESRDSQFFVLGSKDENAGCQGCVMRHLGKNRFAFTLRLPNTFAQKHISFEASFAYGEEHLLEALEREQAISCRFMRDAKGWRIFASTQAVEKIVVSRLRAGCIGVDLNVGHVAVTETDRFGNGIAVQRIPLLLYALSTAQAQTAIAQCVKDMIGYAIRVGKPISIETLNFARKKAQLSYAGPKTQRMLSSFAYIKFAELLKARAFDAGIDVHDVNPAYSSKIGNQKYARRYGLSVHLAAALVLARRAQQFPDRYVSSGKQRSGTTREDRSGHVRVVKETRCPQKAEVVPHRRSAQADPRVARIITSTCAITPLVSSEILESKPPQGKALGSPGARVRPASRTLNSRLE